MSAPEASSSLGRGPRSLVGSALAAAATCGSLLALNGLIEPGDWLSAAVTAVVLLAALTAAVRAAGRAAWLPSLAGTVLGLLGLVVQYGGPRAGTPTLPTPEAAQRTWALAGEGVRLIQESMVPMPPDRGGELIVVAAAMCVFLLVDALALGADTPALGALPLVAFWLPAVLLAFPTNGWALFWTGLAYLLLLALSSAPPVNSSARLRQGSTVVAGAVGALVLAIVAGPLLSALPAWAAVSLPNLGRGIVGPLQLSGELDLRDSLGTRSGQVVLRYTVGDPPADDGASDDAAALAPAPSPSGSARSVVPDARAVGPLRAFSVSDFDGRTWHRGDGGTRNPWASADQVLGFGWEPTDVVDPDDPRLVRVDVDIEGLEQSELPISTFPRLLDVPGSWMYDRARDEVVGSNPTSSGLSYRMRVVVPALTAEDLRGAQIGNPPGSEDFLALPATEHLQGTRALVAELTAQATTPYEQAMAIQSYLRSPANFTYDPRVPPARSGDAVWDFLRPEGRRGYCVQFATAMAVMARTLDIPTRVAVGFLPGEAELNDGRFTYTVTGRQAHAWPELYFEDLGWVRFEPTPAEQTGLPPVWSDPFAGLTSQGPVPTDDINDRDNGSDVALPTVSGGPVGPGAGAAGPGRWAPYAIGGGVPALAGAVVWFLVLRTRRPVELTCEHAWHQLRRNLARHASIDWSDATTPRAAVRTVRARVAEVSGRELEPQAVEALMRLASAVEQERYAPRPSTPTSGELHRWLGTVRHAVERQVSDRSRRGGGPSALPDAP